MLEAVDDSAWPKASTVVYSTDNDPHMNAWPDGGMTPVGNEKNANWERVTGQTDTPPRSDFLYFSDDDDPSGVRSDSWKRVLAEQRKPGTLAELPPHQSP